ncbi:MAG: ABC transporter substrate-binding protein [Oligoflexales bacterium]|nr:ABC transporter substrate-binding protein [Oligoflexales bacterium]
MMFSLSASQLIGVTFLTLTTVASAEIKIGGMATLEGAFKALGDDGILGINMALDEVGGKIGDQKVVLVTASTDGSADRAVSEAKRLIEKEGIKILIGPLSGDEGIAIKELAKSYPDLTFINGGSAAQDTTMKSPAPNFFRFGTDGAQWLAGVGRTAFDRKGYKRVVVIGEDYSFPYTQVYGFIKEFCTRGGKIVKKFWVKIGENDYAPILKQFPNQKEYDAIFLALSGSDVVNFVSQLARYRIKKPLIGGTNAIGGDILTSISTYGAYIDGMLSGGPIPYNYQRKEWLDFVARYKKYQDIDKLTLFAYSYYIATKAAVLALGETGGSVSDAKKLHAVLSNLTFDTPTGKTKLDQNRNGITSNFVMEVYLDKKTNKMAIRTLEQMNNVDQALGGSYQKIAAEPSPSRDFPNCK